MILVIFMIFLSILAAVVPLARGNASWYQGKIPVLRLNTSNFYGFFYVLLVFVFYFYYDFSGYCSLFVFSDILATLMVELRLIMAITGKDTVDNQPGY